MTSFCRVIEQLDEHYALTNEPDVKALAAVRAGLNIDPQFWEDFLQLCNNPNLPYFLEINRSTIAKWPAKIRQHLTHIENMDSQHAATKKSNLITTGF